MYFVSVEALREHYLFPFYLNIFFGEIKIFAKKPRWAAMGIFLMTNNFSHDFKTTSLLFVFLFL